MTMPRWFLRGSRRDERSLIRAAQRGSQDAISTLIEGHWHEAYRAAYLLVQDRGTAEDVTQEAMLAAIRGLQGFDHNRSIRPWIRRIVVNRCLDELRRPHRTREVSLPTPPGHEVGSESSDGALPDEIIRALRALDVDDRALIVLRHLFGYDPRELAEGLGIPPSTLRTRLQRALGRLATELARQETSTSPSQGKEGTT